MVSLGIDGKCNLAPIARSLSVLPLVSFQTPLDPFLFKKIINPATSSGVCRMKLKIGSVLLSSVSSRCCRGPFLHSEPLTGGQALLPGISPASLSCMGTSVLGEFCPFLVLNIFTVTFTVLLFLLQCYSSLLQCS